ncbi:hypothetical protein IV203_030887 [Nitzschia inconspicua]|uniref:Uncharacterized protein n=1 Tax=Nitzschia inconspicua TaxID=303405 RepID=A0A9K3Q4L9_9STRA|nr:hypothetical protein IV203_030887 [Nitzschia inconspicua]
MRVLRQFNKRSNNLGISPSVAAAESSLSARYLYPYHVLLSSNLSDNGLICSNNNSSAFKQRRLLHRATHSSSICHAPLLSKLHLSKERYFHTNDSTDKQSHVQKNASSNNATHNDNQKKKKNKHPSLAGPITSIQQAQTAMQHLLDQLDELPTLSPPTVLMLRDGGPRWSLTEQELRQATLQQTHYLFDAICQAVKQGHLKPSQKHAEELSRLVECVLYNYSCCCSGQSESRNVKQATFPLSNKCQQVLNVLNKEWNLDIQNNHYQHAISVANQEGNYKLASSLFERQIDPNAGNTPVPVAIDNPQGLYAIAMLHAPSDPSASSTAAEHVMDAVQRLIMVSPHDQTAYVLAAGNALGYAGRWQDHVEYWKSSFLSKQWGTPLIAAVMQACWLCQKPDEAWNVLEESNLLVIQSQSSPSVVATTTPGFGGEWQYGGERDLMDPLVRDMAMKVVNSFQPPNNNQEDDAASNFPSVSQVALDLYRQIQQEGTSISLEALTGVVQACERDGEWQEALSIVWDVLENKKEARHFWIVSGNHLLIEDRDRMSIASLYDTQQLHRDMGGLLASVMRSCNVSSNFGISLFLLSLLQNRMSLSSKNGGDADPSNSRTTALLAQIRDPDEVLAASMVSLCGLRCYKDAMELFQSYGDASDNLSANRIYEYAKANDTRFGTLVLGNPWASAQRHIWALTQLVDTLKGRTNLHEEQRLHVIHTLAACMNSCINAHQPELALQLIRWIDGELFQYAMSNSNFSLGTGLLTDALAAEYIIALRWANDVPGAISMFEECLAKHQSDLSEWKMTVSAGLMAMVAGGRGDDAVKFFEALDEEALCTKCYTTIGRYLSEKSDWKEVINLYRDATARGFSSEDLSFMAMKAVTSTRIENRLRILRAIVAECASDVGVDPQSWVTNRYWHIKRELGFDYARLLMWWNDPERATLDELILAIKEFDKEVSSELRPKNDVLRAIVKGASLLDALHLESVDGYERVPKSVPQWTSLLENVLTTIQDSPIHCDPNFIDSVVQAYKNLGCSRECISYIQGIISSDFVRLRKSTLQEVLEAARMEQEMELSKDIEMLLNTSY